MATAVTLPPGFELQPQPPTGTGMLPGEAAAAPPALPQPQGGGMGAPAAPAAPAAVPALPPGFQLQQPAPKRDVGVGEGVARIIGQSAIPATRMLGLAAASVAGVFGGEEAQDAVFQKVDEAIGSMRRVYEFKPDEEVGMGTQIVGGLASMPIEVVGGMGVQRGIDRSTEVLRRGGTMEEAATAGGVTGAANVAANLLPVKAGGAVGRVIEGQLGRSLGSKAGQVAGGALTGGAIGAAGDIGVTEASNLALPEGKAFEDLQQEADPLVSFGLGAAFGGAAARGERRGGRQAAGEPQDTPAPGMGGLMPGRAGAEAPAGSVGAAGADVETARRERAAALPVPIELTKGQASRRFEEQQFEREQAKNAETGGALREHFDEQNERLAKNFDAFVDMTGAEQTSQRGVGEAVDRALRQKMDARRDEIRQAYDAAREAGDMAEPVKTDDLVAYLNQTGPESINAPVLQTVREKLVQLGGAQRDGEGGLLAGEIPINDLEEIRKMINRVSDSTPTNMTFGRELKDRIDSLTADAGGDLYREARRLRTNFGREFNNRAVINDLVRNKRGTADRAVALEDVFDRAILRRSLDDVRHLRRVLQTAGDDGAQAWRELQGQTLRHIQDQALRNASRDQRGNPVVSFAGLNNAIRELDGDGRLEFIFGKKGAEQLRDLNDIAADVVTSPPGSVNTSNTGSMLVNALDTMLTFSASGIPVPAFGVLRKAMQTMRERGVRKRVAAAIEQPKGLRAADDSRPRFGQIDEDTGEIDPRETPQAQGDGGADPRLAEIERLRGVTQNPEALAVLDARQRKVEAEITAGEQQRERALQAEELDALARSSSDPEIRRSLAARAEKLRGGPIPVGEATELPVERVDMGGDMLPVGEATEVDVETVEPAPRPPEGTRTAAGSDPDADLTMLYKRAGKGEGEKPAAAPPKREAKGTDQSVSTRLPTAVKATEDPQLGKVDLQSEGDGITQAGGAGQVRAVQNAGGSWVLVGRDGRRANMVTYESRAAAEADARDSTGTTNRLQQPGFDITDAMRGKAAGGVPMFKQQGGGDRAGGLPAKPFKKRADLENSLRAKLGHKLVDGLLRRNVITLGEAPADAPRDAQGRFTGSVVELFHDRLDDASAAEVLMHEVGEHYGMEKMLGASRYAELMDDIRKMRQRPEVAKTWATVKRNYPDLEENDPRFVREVAAHLVETASDRPIVRRMLDAPRAYLYRNFGVNIGGKDPALVRALAVGALRKSAGVEALSASPTALAAAGMRETEDDEALAR